MFLINRLSIMPKLSCLQIWIRPLNTYFSARQSYILPIDSISINIGDTPFAKPSLPLDLAFTYIKGW